MVRLLQEGLKDFSQGFFTVCHTVSPLRGPMRKVFPGPKSSFVVNLIGSRNPLNGWLGFFLFALASRKLRTLFMACF